MSRSAIEQEIQAMEKKLAMGFENEVPPACGPMAEEFPPQEDDLGMEIAALEEEIKCCERKASHKYDGEILEDADKELADLYNEINAEDEKVIKDGEGDAGFFSGGECQNVRCRKPTPEAALMASEGKRVRKADQIDNPEEPHGKGGLWQDKDVVEMEMGVDDKGEDTLDVVRDSTKFQDSEFIYASNLKEASFRLDRVANVLEKRGGAWKKFAFRLDKIADSIDSERNTVVTKIASRRIASRKQK